MAQMQARWADQAVHFEREKHNYLLSICCRLKMNRGLTPVAKDKERPFNHFDQPAGSSGRTGGNENGCRIQPGQFDGGKLKD